VARKLELPAGDPLDLTGRNLAALDVPASGGNFVLELTVEQQRMLANGIASVMAR
jgi:hypothetical protein